MYKKNCLSKKRGEKERKKERERVIEREREKQLVFYMLGT